MPRPAKCRRVAFIPQETYFIPAGGSVYWLEEVVLSVEEIEALRLRDMQGLEQEECAVGMNISRATFQRVLASARTKVTDALVHGKAIRVEGGNFYTAPFPYYCGNCGYEWEAVPAEGGNICPRCASRNAFCKDCLRWRGGRGWGRCGRGGCSR